MQCTSPWYYEKLETILPCGHCRACRIARSREWSIRIWHELIYHEKACFLTLTYDDEHLPNSYELVKSDLQAFLKRLRNYVDGKIRYYCVGEYGEQTGRPHYHGIIFGISIGDNKVFKKKNGVSYCLSGPFNTAWDKGNIALGSVEKDSIQYVTSYIHKKLYGEAAEEDGRVQPFAIMSQGIGKKYADQYGEEMKRRGKITVFGQEVSVPKYYARRLGIEEEVQGAFDDRAEVQERIIRRYGEEKYAEIMKKSRMQKEKELKAVEEKYSKGEL